MFVKECLCKRICVCVYVCWRECECLCVCEFKKLLKIEEKCQVFNKSIYMLYTIYLYSSVDRFLLQKTLKLPFSYVLMC